MAVSMDRSSSGKILLCRPRGGLNDTLCQLERSWSYAERSARKLIIDTNKSGVLLNFDRLFSQRLANSKVLFHLPESQIEFLNTLSCYPKPVQGKIDTYQALYSDEYNYYVEEQCEEFRFELLDHCSEQLLVYEQCGGGTKSRAFFERVTFSNSVIDLVEKAIVRLGENYAAIHVRHTDYKSDYGNFFRQVSERVRSKRLLICSDSTEVISLAKSIFKSSDVVTNSLPVFTDTPLHYPRLYTTDEQRWQATTNSLIDLVTLANASELFLCPLKGGNPLYSGFSQLAGYLNENRGIISALLKRGQ
jgi:hypothetical protein